MMDSQSLRRRKSTSSYNPTASTPITRKRRISDANSFRVELNDDQNKSSDDISFEDGTFITDVVEITESRNINKMLEFRILRKDQKKREWVANFRVIAPELVAKFLGEQALIKDVRHILGKRTTDTGDIQYLVQRESSKHNIPEWIDCLKLLAPDKISKYEQSEANRKIRLHKTLDYEDVFVEVDQNIVPNEIIARLDFCDELYYLARNEHDSLGLFPEKYLMDNYIGIVTKYYKLMAFNH